MTDEITALRAEVERLTFLKDEFKTCATAMQRGQDEAVADRKAAEAERDEATAQLAQANMDVEKILAEFNVLSAMYIKKTGEVPRQDNIDPRARDMLEVIRLSSEVRRLAKKGLTSPVTEEALDEVIAKLKTRGE